MCRAGEEGGCCPPVKGGGNGEGVRERKGKGKDANGTNGYGMTEGTSRYEKAQNVE